MSHYSGQYQGDETNHLSKIYWKLVKPDWKLITNPQMNQILGK